MGDGRRKVEEFREAYSVGRGVLLLGGEDCTAALGGVECGFALDDRLAGTRCGATSTATNLGDGIPFLSSRHRDGLCVVVV